MTHNYVGKIGSHTREKIPGEPVIAPPDEELVQQDIDARRAISWWRAKYGENI